MTECAPLRRVRTREEKAVGDNGTIVVMGLERVAVAWVNRILRPLDLQLSTVEPTVWDRQFVGWIRDAKAAGRDPNDVGDERWREDLLDTGLREHYLPAVGPESVVLELGPGSGRLSRHLIGRCRELILVDASQMVCDWLSRYLEGKGRFRVYRIDGPRLAMVQDKEIDAVFAHGVVEHLDLDELYWFLAEFGRVLRPGGKVGFNFDNVLTDRGVEVMLQDGPKDRALFRVHHPESIRRVAEVAGFEGIEIFSTPGRIGFVQLTKA
jgi:SAM-dependent methyltransferase